MWFVNMSAVFPPVLLFDLTVLPHLGDLNALIRTLLLSRLQRFFRSPRTNRGRWAGEDPAHRQ
jgi:antibiotic biosynthesis monooxygenase (ABM) superfamily enzyme